MINDWVGQVLANGRYVVTARLGEGGMGTVYRARDQNIDADVVVKVPLRSMLADAEFAARFKNEIRSLVLLSHPHIVKVSDVGEHDGLPFAVMQYLPGGSLEDRLKQGRSDPREVFRWLGKIAGALDFVHARGYVHRDVKPGNILFDLQGHPFLGDFGVVKVLTDSADATAARTSITGAGMVIGTAEYMAPELIMGEPFDGRVDQYALAATVYEMIGGKQIFSDSVKTKILVLQTTKPVTPLVSFCPEVSQSVSDVVLKGVSKSPTDRYSTCLKFAQALGLAIQASPIPTSTTAEPSKSMERVRVPCPSCARAILIPVADHARLSRTGAAFPCPGCQATVQIQGDARPVGNGSGTVKVPAQSASGTMKLPLADIATIPVGTMKLPATGAPPASAATTKLSAQSAVSASTMKLPTNREGGLELSTPGSDDQFDLLPAIKPTGSGWSVGPEVPSPAEEVAPTVSVPLLSGLAVVSLLAIGIAFWAFGTAQTPTKATPKIATGYRASVVKALPVATPSPFPSPSAPPVSKPVELPRTTIVASVSPTKLPSRPPLVVESKEVPEETPDAAMAEEGEAGEMEPDAPPVVVGPPDRIAPRTKKEGVAFSRVLATPKLYADEGVELGGVFCIANVIGRGPDGSFTLPVIRCGFHVARNGNYKVDIQESLNIEVEPTLAKRLLDARIVSPTNGVPPASAWGPNPAILTVYAASKGEGWSVRIMKLAFLIEMEAKSIVAGAGRRLHVEFKTIEVTTKDAQHKNLGDDVIWGATTQFGPVVSQLRRLVEAAEKTPYQVERPALRAQAILSVNAATNYWTGHSSGPNIDPRMRELLLRMVHR